MPETPTPRNVLGVILLTVFLDLVGFSIIFPLFPDMLEYYLGQERSTGILHQLVAYLQQLSGFTGDEAEFAATVLFGGLLGSLYSLLQFLASPIWGAWSDAAGRRKILVVTTLGTAVGYLLWIFADSFWLLVLSRVVGGLMAGNISVATAAVADVTDESSRAKGMGMIGAAFGIGFIVGPVLGAVLSQWDVTTLLPTLPGLNPFSLPATVALVLATANFLWVLRSFPETRDSQHVATHARRPLNPLQLLRPFDLPGVDRTNLLYFVFILAFAGMEFTLTFLAKDRFGYSAAQNGYLFLFIGILIALVQGGIIRRIAPKYGEKRLVLLGLLLIVPGLLLVAVCQHQFVLYLGLALLAIGSSLVTPCLTSMVSLYAPAERQGEVLGVFRSVGALARAVGPLAAAGAYWRWGSHWPYLGSALLLLVPLALGFGLPATEHPGRNTSDD